MTNSYNKEFNLDAEITELNTPLRYSSTRLKYFYTEQDVKGLFEKCENYYLKLIEEKDKEIKKLERDIEALYEDAAGADL